MQDNRVQAIIELCRKIDETARDVYEELSTLCKERELSDFWKAMSKEESEHVAFWKRAERVDALSGMTNLFEKPEEVIADLSKALSGSKNLLRRCRDGFSVPKAFTLSYRMEFYLLHPAFEMLFYLFGPAVDGPNPADNYESHIANFISMLSKKGQVTPEFELLGETLQRLWKENRRLALRSTRDELTGVYNRRGFFAHSVLFAHLAQRNDSTVAVMMIDLDHFKTINDRFGHTTGDRVLKATAALLTKHLRASDIVGRYGGEEFIVLLTQINPGAALGVAENIRQSIEENPPEGVPLTISIGFAENRLSHQVQKDYQQLIQRADTALYEAKKKGRNRTEKYSPRNQ